MKKTKIPTTIAIIVITTMTLSLFALPTILPVGSQTDLSHLEWYNGINVAPNPVGVNQRVTIIAGFTMPTAAYGRPTFDGWTVTAKQPDGETVDLGPYNSDSTGLFFATFTPNQIGEWEFQAHYPGGTADFLDVSNAYVPPTDTEVFVLTVQQEAIPEYPVAPLPQEYWEMPINGQNRAWHDIAGPWLMPGGQSGGRSRIAACSKNYYTSVPEAGHILWSRQDVEGGLVTGATEKTYYDGSAYRPAGHPPVIINGKFYANYDVPPYTGFYCIDIHTGEEVYFIENPSFPDGKGGIVEGRNALITAGQILNIDTRNWHGGQSYLWSTFGTTWAVWDAFSGGLMHTIVNAPRINTLGAGATLWANPITGDLTTYQYYAGSNSLVYWNSTKMFDEAGFAGDDLGTWARHTNLAKNIDWNLGIEWNITLPQMENLGGAYGDETGFLVDLTDDSRIIISNQTRARPTMAQGYMDICVSSDGEILWHEMRDEGTWEEVSIGNDVSIEQDIYVRHRKETKELYAYSVSTGSKLWVTEPRDSFWAFYPRGPAVAYDKVISNAYDGIIQCHNVDGTLEWDWGPIDSGYETPYGVYPFIGGITVADHKILINNHEHSAQSPLYRGERMYCIDLESGDTLWSLSGWWQTQWAANGIVMGVNQYDGKLYAIGKGPSKTTVSTQEVPSIWGDSVMIKGMVTDISPGTTQSEQALRFPNGVPAIADQYMSEWMEYVYMQQPLPSSVSGVEVILETLDPNNNYYEIGRATSDGTGMYKLLWEPLVPGEYTIIARFDGTDSYWGSSAETALGVVEVTGGTPIEPEQPTEQPTEPEPEAPFITTEIAIIIAIAVIAVVAIVAYWAIRKRK